jgi:hypothetical protein
LRLPPAFTRTKTVKCVKLIINEEVMGYPVWYRAKRESIDRRKHAKIHNSG